jgi:hypothetical protein
VLLTEITPHLTDQSLQPFWYSYGFLPLQGLEVPLMVMQSKVFLIVALRDFSPLVVSRQKSFIRRVQSSLRGLARDKDDTDLNGSQLGNSSDGDDLVGSNRSFDVEAGAATSGEVSQTEAMRLFTKIPFPEPKRVIRLRARIME